jgi:hypothetical protein
MLCLKPTCLPPGVVKSNHLERTTFYGKEPQEERKTFRQTVRTLPISQTPQEVGGGKQVVHALCGNKKVSENACE